MAKVAPLEVVIRVTGLKELRDLKDQIEPLIETAQSAAWLEGMNHALSWLGLKQYGDVMAKDNPHGREA